MTHSTCNQLFFMNAQIVVKMCAARSLLLSSAKSKRAYILATMLITRRVIIFSRSISLKAKVFAI